MADDTTAAQGHPQAPQPNPALKDLAVFVGEWEMELSNASFLPDPAATAKGAVFFEWVQDGAFLVMRIGDKASGPPAARWLIGRDESDPDYTMLYADARGVSRVYEMSFNAGTWKIWRASPGFSQRFEGILSDDGKTITARWERSGDGSQWEHDFNLTYRRVRGGIS